MGSPNRRLSWLDWLNTLLLGLLLAGLQGLVTLAVLLNWLVPQSWWIFLGGGALSTVLLPGYAGWLAAAQTGERRAGVTSGCTGGLLGFVLFTLLFGGWIQLHQSYHSGLWAGAPMLIEVVLEGGVGGLLAICGIAFGVERGLRRFGSPPQTAEAEGPASDEEA